jgi:two-component system nitrate/nitrite response regulator NarL
VDAAQRNGALPQNGPAAHVTADATNPVKVLLADREAIYIWSLSGTLHEHAGIDLISTANSGFQALERIEAERPTVAVLDPGLPGLDGLAILNAIERAQIPTRVVFITHETEKVRPFDAISGGARGYLTRDASHDQVCEAIIAAAGDGVTIDPELQPGLIRELFRRAASADDRLDAGTREVLELTADGLTPAEVADSLQIAPSTVKGRLHAVYKRLGVSNATAAVAEAVRQELIS